MKEGIFKIWAGLPRFFVQTIATLFVGLAATVARAQTDEIQVYDAEIAEPGKFNLTLHNNFTPAGRKTPEFPGAIEPDKSLNGVPEWAYGVCDWFEAGLYLPVYSISQNHGVTFDSTKLRTLFVSPHAADRTFFYGLNLEYSYNEPYWEPTRFSGEIRPILGLHLRPVDIIVNPIVDTDFKSFGSMEFVPAARIAYNINTNWAVAAEEYADFGQFHQCRPANEQMHQIYAVLDRSTKIVNIEFGMGFGLTSASDKLTLKLMLSRNLN